MGDSLWAVEDSTAVVRRIKYALPIVGVLMAVVGGAIWGWRSAVGVLAGTGLAMANFKFLHDGLRSVLALGRPQPPSGTTLIFAFRWIIVATIGYTVYRTGWATGAGILTGLFSPLLAILGEAVYQVIHSLTRRDRNDVKRG